MPKAPPVLLLTRPAAQSARFLHECEDGLGRPVKAVISPIMGIEPRTLTVDPRRFAGVVFTSENAVTALGRPDWSRGVTAWCVGRRTADAAAAAGFTALSAEGDAQALLARILADRPEGPLLHLGGAHLASDIAAELTQSGVPAETVVVYDQVAVPLTTEARDRRVRGGPACDERERRRGLGNRAPGREGCGGTHLCGDARARACGIGGRLALLTARPESRVGQSLPVR